MEARAPAVPVETPETCEFCGHARYQHFGFTVTEHSQQTLNVRLCNVANCECITSPSGTTLIKDPSIWKQYFRVNHYNPERYLPDMVKRGELDTDPFEATAEPLFQTGDLLCSPDAWQACQMVGVDPLALIQAHARGDWGESPMHVVAANNELAPLHAKAFDPRYPDELQSTYPLDSLDDYILVITCPSVQRTFVLLEEEYL